MTKDEALKLALEYMNERLEDHDSKFMRHPATEAERDIILANIKEVKEALAQPAQEPSQASYPEYDRGFSEGWDRCKAAAQPAQRQPLTTEAIRAAGGIVHKDGNVFFTNVEQLNRAIEAAPPAAQPAQEPVAWMCSAFDGEPCEQTHHDECENPIPLYTTPHQRPWVGLTQDQFSKATRLAEDGEYLVALELIQQCLRRANT